MIGVLRTDAGTATPLLSGGYLCDLGDAFPTFTATRDQAWDVLTTRTNQPTNRTTPRRNPGRLTAGPGAVGP